MTDPELLDEPTMAGIRSHPDAELMALQRDPMRLVLQASVAALVNSQAVEAIRAEIIRRQDEN